MNAPPVCAECATTIDDDDIQIVVPCENCGGSHTFHFDCALAMCEKYAPEGVAS